MPMAPKFYLTSYKRLIIAEILDENNKKTDLSRYVHDAISNAIFSMDGIHVLDREKSEVILRELEFQSSGLVNPSFMQKGGQFHSSSIILVGRITTDYFDSKTLTSSGLFRECKTQRYRKATYTISLSFKLIDMRTTKVVFSDLLEIKEREETDRVCGSPPKISKQLLYEKALKSIGNRFHKLFVEHSLIHEIEFQRNRKFNDQLKRAVTLIKVGEFKEAHIILQTIVNQQKKPKTLSSALYNLAVFQKYNGFSEQAQYNAKRGFMVNPNNEACLDLYKNQ